MSTITILLLCLASFCAGFIDAIAGGGGLLQVPAGLLLLPNLPVSTVIGTLKIPAFSGTSLAAVQYLRKVEMNWKRLGVMCACSFCTAFLGSEVLTHVSNNIMKPVLLVVLSFVALYTFFKKDFGMHVEKDHSARREWFYAISMSLALGFYDGFIGPGMGSFLLLVFIALLGFDFLHASANAKMVNLATNLGSILLFILKGKIIWTIALPMAVSNAAGGACGAKLAIAKGNRFIRIFFLLVVIGTLIRLAWDVFKL